MKILYHYLKGFWPLVLLALFTATINQGFSLLDPLIFQRIIDNFVVPASQDAVGMSKNDFLSGVGLLVLAAIGVAMVSRIAKAFQDYYVNVITKRLGAKIYTNGVEHSLELPYSVFEDQRSGETLGILEKVRSDVERLVQLLINVLFTTLISVIFVIGYTASIHWLIPPFFLLMMPALGWLSSLLSKGIKKIQRQIVDESTALAGSTTESLRNIEMVRSLGLSRQETNRLNMTTEKILKLDLKKVVLLRRLSFIQGTFVNFLRNSLLMLMVYLVFMEHIQPGELFALLFYSFFIFGPLQSLGEIINTYRETEASLENFQRIMATPKEPRPEDPKGTGRIHDVVFDDVSFQHRTAKTKALDGISFRARQGETIAFVGPSGAGKTTMVKLLVGLYQPQKGHVYYNGKDSGEIDIDELREQIGFVSQDTQLFSGTIKENLQFVAPQATDTEIMDVLQKSACDNLLERAENGIDTVIGEGGVKVSGGEKQRLAIARALLRHPNILVFDEATSALDSLTEESITKTIRNISLSKKHLTFLIAHRLSTIMHADMIYVLERGTIIESGEHKKLLKENRLYYAMWRQQIGERELTDLE